MPTATSCTDGAAAALRTCACTDACTPDVAAAALPPDLFAAAGCDHSWGQSAVARRVPFGGDFRLGCCKIVEACQHFFVRAVWAAAAVCTGGNDGLKAVALFAAPPRLAVACGCDLLRGQSAVARCVPLRGQRGLLRSEVIEARQDLLPGADRAAAQAACAHRDCCAPVVAAFAYPPDFFSVPGSTSCGR